MPIQFKRKVSKASRSLRVNIPSEVADKLHIRSKDVLSIWVSHGQVNMKKIKRKA
jgi:bifunctional DNA-binding transcriptional regulator/antitoxin component of YhaV-PrlF toxin-antitoxin module